MSRIATSNYGADATTQFQWATTDDDLFSRTLDLYYMSQALELHDHSAGRGIPVARVAAGAVDAAALAALSVATGTLQDLAVTNGKLASGAVTRDKITMPLVQATNDFAGGIRVRETANNYALGFYMAANGLAVFGAGTPSVIGTNLILGQTGQVSVGTIQGGALFNVLQTSNAIGGGIRCYNSNTGFFADLFDDSNGNFQLFTVASSVPAFTAQNTTAKISVGAAVQFTGRLNLTQGSGTAAEGYFQVFGGGNFTCFVDTNGDVNLRSAGTSLMLKHSAAALHPLVNAGADLGLTGTRWGAAFLTTLNVSGAVTFGSTVTFSGGLGALSGVTGITLTGSTPLITGVNQIQMAGTAAGSFITPVGSGNTALGDATHRFAAVYCTSVETSSASHFGNDALPTVDGGTSGTALGNASFRWGGIYLAFAGTAFKPGGGTWTDPSDDRTKIPEKFRPYQSGLDTVLALDPVYYTFNGDYGTAKDQEFIGLRAQATQKVAPELVGKTMRPKHPGDPEEEILTLDASAMPYMLVNAIKTLERRVRELEDRRN